MSYAERLRPPWWWYALAVVLAVAVGVQVGAATSAGAGYVGALVTGVAAGVLLELWALEVRVADGALRAGRSRLPLAAAGSPEPLRGEELRVRLGRDADPAAHLVIRPWARAGVLVEVTDAVDPTPYWIVATHDPERLAAALRG